MPVIFSLLFVLLTTAANAETYQCSTEFGESVPLKKTVLKPNQFCKACDDAQVSPPVDAVDFELTQEWNAAVAQNKSLTTKRKRKSYLINNRVVLLDWRYVKTSGPSFRLAVECPSNSAKCRGSFLDQSSRSEFKIETQLADGRIPNNRGWVEFHLSDREHLDLRVRVFKEATGDGKVDRVPVSASGEKLFLRTDAGFIMDVGADENLLILENVRHRLAALEIKIRCEPEVVR